MGGTGCPPPLPVLLPPVPLKGARARVLPQAPTAAVVAAGKADSPAPARAAAQAEEVSIFAPVQPKTAQVEEVSIFAQVQPKAAQVEEASIFAPVQPEPEASTPILCPPSRFSHPQM